MRIHNELFADSLAYHPVFQKLFKDADLRAIYICPSMDVLARNYRLEMSAYFGNQSQSKGFSLFPLEDYDRDRLKILLNFLEWLYAKKHNVAPMLIKYVQLQKASRAKVLYGDWFT